MNNDRFIKRVFDGLLISIIIIIFMFGLFAAVQLIISFENNLKSRIEEING
jgi:hypothetical protein